MTIIMIMTISSHHSIVLVLSRTIVIITPSLKFKIFQPFFFVKFLPSCIYYEQSSLALRIRAQAEKSEKFRDIICLPPANIFHFYEAKIKFRFMNIGKVRMAKVPKMSEKEAVKLGANLFAEFCFYSVASGILSYYFSISLMSF